MNTKLQATILTLITLIFTTGMGYLFWNYHSQTLYFIIGLICLLFIRHTYVAFNYLLNNKD
jgi:hypothetical protein